MEFTLYDRKASPDFRNNLFLEYPALKDSVSLLKLFVFLGYSKKNEDENIVISAKILAEIEGKIFDSNYSAIRFLNEFRGKVFNFEIRDYDYSSGKARECYNLEISENIKYLIDEELISCSTNKVWLITGSKITSTHTAKIRQDKLEYFHNKIKEIELNRDLTIEQSNLLNYMNGLNPDRFKIAVNKHLAKAKETAKSLKDSDNQLKSLAEIEIDPKPVYIPAEKSNRIYATGSNINGLHRDIRKVFQQDWITADLKSAQLAIIAKLWDIPKLSAYLKTGINVWEDLCNYINIDFNPNNKQLLKTYIYSVIYGAGKNRIVLGIAEDIDEDMTTEQKLQTAEIVYNKLKEHKIIKLILTARNKQFKIIEANNGATNCFGQFYELKSEIIPDKYVYKDMPYVESNLRSILACCAQDYELKIWTPVINSAIEQENKDRGFTITNYLHDGITFSSHKSKDIEKWKNEIYSLVEKECNKLNIYTSVEFS